ncbi:hypothetical protein Tco_0248407 [Tanacetum coccineum]
MQKSMQGGWLRVASNNVIWLQQYVSSVLFGTSSSDSHEVPLVLATPHKVTSLSMSDASSVSIANGESNHLYFQEISSSQTTAKYKTVNEEVQMQALEDGKKTQGRNYEDLMFDTGALNGDEVFQEPILNTDTTIKSSIQISAKKLTLAQTLIEIKSAKPKAVTTAATTVTPASSRPKAKGIVFHDQEEQAPASTIQLILSLLSTQTSFSTAKTKAKIAESERVNGQMPGVKRFVSCFLREANSFILSATSVWKKIFVALMVDCISFGTQQGYIHLEQMVPRWFMPYGDKSLEGIDRKTQHLTHKKDGDLLCLTPLKLKLFEVMVYKPQN